MSSDVHLPATQIPLLRQTAEPSKAHLNRSGRNPLLWRGINWCRYGRPRSKRFVWHLQWTELIGSLDSVGRFKRNEGGRLLPRVAFGIPCWVGIRYLRWIPHYSIAAGAMNRIVPTTVHHVDAASYGLFEASLCSHRTGTMVLACVKDLREG